LNYLSSAPALSLVPEAIEVLEEHARSSNPVLAERESTRTATRGEISQWM